jgi:catechol 2,3-dioxygenase-like lactoylglutathione lyase family enzyme
MAVMSIRMSSQRWSSNSRSNSSSETMKINKVVETCIYSSDLESMKKFYVDIIGLSIIEEEKDKLIFLRAGKTMLLIFDPAKTSINNDKLPTHGAITPPSSIHLAMEIEHKEYQPWKDFLIKNGIEIEKEVRWSNSSSGNSNNNDRNDDDNNNNNNAKSLYFRDPAGNLLELITPGAWPIER